jgi:hypothetical protein
LIERGTTCTYTCPAPPQIPTAPIGISACAGIPGCSNDIGSCPSPLAGAVCSGGAWTVSGNVDVSQLGFVGCNLQISGALTSSASSNLRIHACARITATSTVSLAGTLSLDIYNTSMSYGTQVTVTQGSSLSGTFATVVVTGFSITDGEIPFKAGYSTTRAYVDFYAGKGNGPQIAIGDSSSREVLAPLLLVGIIVSFI